MDARDLGARTDMELPSNCDPRIRGLHSHWRSLHPGPGVLPGRQHLDPCAIPRLLPWIWMVDVDRRPLRFKYRLIGTEQVAAMGRDVTGWWLDEAHDRFQSSRPHADFVAAAEQGRPSYRRGPPVFHVDKDYVLLERLLLPLARNGAAVDMLLAITIYHSAAADRAPVWVAG